MKNTVRVNAAKGLLVMDRTFAKKSQDVRSEEYELLQRVRRDYPNFPVVVRRIKRNSQKETYAGLTYAYMEAYIKTHEEGEAFEAVMAEYRELLLIAKCHAKSRRYPTIKKWFLKKYPAVAMFGVEKDEEVTPTTEEEPEYEPVMDAFEKAS